VELWRQWIAMRDTFFLKPVDSRWMHCCNMVIVFKIVRIFGEIIKVKNQKSLDFGNLDLKQGVGTQVEDNWTYFVSVLFILSIFI